MTIKDALLLLAWCTAALLQNTAALGLAGAPVSAQVAICADCWTKKALGSGREDAGGPHVTCEAVVVTAYWVALKITDDANDPKKLCLAMSWPATAAGGQRVVRCEVEVEVELGGVEVGSSAFASVGISYAYNPRNLQEAPKVTLQGQICPTSLRDLPSHLTDKLRQGVGAASQTVHKSTGVIPKKARAIEGHFKRPFP